MTVQDVQNATFDKGMRGYQVEQVDSFLDKVAEQLEQDEKRIAELTAQIAALEAKMGEMGSVVEKYHADENALKAALLNAQRMGESVIREARQQADGIVREASIRAENITGAAQARIVEQENELVRVKSEVTQFKANVLSLYKAHIESLSTLPEYEAADAAAAAAAAAPAPAEPEVKPVEAPVAEATPAAAPAPAAAEPEEPAEPTFTWETSEVTTEAAPAPAAEADNNPFRGITFSD